jgi:aminotransferase in exopolysaccharide biosynthesis
MFDDVINHIKGIYHYKKFIPLHEPTFFGNEKKYLNDCIDSTFVSSVGKYVDRFEKNIAKFTNSKYAVATSNGTSALHIALLISNVGEGEEVITQPLTFVATCNAISYCKAHPIFLDVDRETLGLSPAALKIFLKSNTIVENNQCINRVSGRVIRACLPVHTFGHPCRIEEISEICDEFNINLIEDCAESLGSFYKNKHTGTFGKLGAFSFNGNKIITSGGGGCIVTNDESLAIKAKHLSTTSKVDHKWEYSHDMTGYNYRMPNLNAALLLAQLENLDKILEKKRELTSNYIDFFKNTSYEFINEPKDCKSNFWLNSLLLKDKSNRERFLGETNSNGVMTRPIWTMMNKLKMFNDAQCDSLENSEWLEQRIVNIPSTGVMK